MPQTSLHSTHFLLPLFIFLPFLSVLSCYVAYIVDAGIGLARGSWGMGRAEGSVTHQDCRDWISELEAVEFHETYSIASLLSASSVLSACTSCGFTHHFPRRSLSFLLLTFLFFSAKKWNFCHRLCTLMTFSPMWNTKRVIYSRMSSCSLPYKQDFHDKVFSE